MGNVLFPVRRFSFTITEHDPAKPWLIVRTERRTVELDDDQDFYSWAEAQWPEIEVHRQLTRIRSRAFRSCQVSR